MKLTYLFSTIFLLTANSALASVSPPDEPNLYDKLMASTIGNYSIKGHKFSYMLSGQMNYGYGIEGYSGGFHNSYLDFDTNFAFSNGVDLGLSVGGEDVYQANKADYEAEVDFAVKAQMGGHGVRIGRDKFLSNYLFAGKTRPNSDAAHGRNLIGQKLSSYVGFAEYSYSHQSYSVTSAFGFDGSIYLGASGFIDGTDVRLHAFKVEDDINMFLDLGFFKNENYKFSGSVGMLNKNLAFMLDGSYFLTDSVSTYASVSGDAESSNLVLGVEYFYGSFSAYLEGNYELQSPDEQIESNNGVIIGAKFTF